ncbi:MAG TPA: hypothetical protein VFW99_00740 [Candidatus Nitrosotalea sp.]|nr:hypothetical protein [Candidatus Nitrosotalea sp.]
MNTKKKNKVRIVKLDSINYTFIDETIPQTDSKQKENDTKKKPRFVRNTLKDAKTSKTHYKSNSRSPKSQQNHSPVYE